MSQLSLDKPISHLESVKNLQDRHPVFLLVADDGSHIVIKQESTNDAESLRRNQLAMQMASRQSRSVILTAPEVQTLNAYVSRRHYIAAYRPESPVPPDVVVLQGFLRRGGTWFKMIEAKGLVNLSGIARQVLDGDKSGARAMAKAFNSAGGMEALGKIVGADMFNNNADRFLPNVPGKTFVRKSDGSEHAFSTKALANVGNVMAATTDGKLKAIGLDSWDPSNEYVGDMNRPARADEWFGALLAPSRAANRLAFAKDICDDLNLLLGPRNRRFDFLQQTRLDSDAPQRLVKGMEAITKKLIAKLEASIKRPNAPAGLQSRLNILLGR
jgi:hypothetical protein